MSTAESRELVLFVNNDQQFYRSRLQPTYKNQVNKMAKGDYDSNKADKQWQRIAKDASKEYEKQYGGERTFSKEDIDFAAKEMKEDFEEEAKNGEYDDLLYEKYKNKKEKESYLESADKSSMKMNGKGKGWHGERMRHREASMKRGRK